MTNYEIVMDLINHIHTKDQAAMFILQMIQQGQKHKLDDIEMVNQWLNNEADRVTED